MTLAQNINNALVTALDFSSRTTSINDTASASDHMKTIECTATLTASLPTATTIGAGFVVGYYNNSTGFVTINLQTGTDTLDGTVGGSIVLNSGQSLVIKTNTAATGYFSIASFAGALSISTNTTANLYNEQNFGGF